VRGKPERFAEHYNQATLFWNSQSAVEKQHIIRAFRFELTRVQTVAVRERVVAQLRNVAAELAEGVAEGLGITELPDPLPKLTKRSVKPELDRSEALSLLVRPGTVGIATRRIAILVADGVEGESAIALHEALEAEGAVPRFVGIKMGAAESATGDPVEVEVSMEAAPSCLWDAVVVAAGEGSIAALSESGHAKEFLKDQYRHCKPMLFLGGATAVAEAAGIPLALPTGEADPGILQAPDDDAEGAAAAFKAALAQHRHFERETDPPLV
jgi:catalase